MFCYHSAVLFDVFFSYNLKFYLHAKVWNTRLLRYTYIYYIYRFPRLDYLNTFHNKTEAAIIVEQLIEDVTWHPRLGEVTETNEKLTKN